LSVSVFDLFSIGIGPSSSHTVVELFGSLGATGKGHGSPKAVVLGLLGESPEEVDVSSALDRYEHIKKSGVLRLGGSHEIEFSRSQDLILHFRKSLDRHSNGR